MVVYTSSRVGVCSPEKTLLVWRVMKLVLPVEGEPRRRIVRFFFGVV